MATVTLFNVFALDAVSGVHDLSSDTLKVALTDTAPSTTSNAGYADLTEIASGNGYTTGGVTATVDTLSQTSGAVSLVLSGVSWTASGGDIATHRYAVLYNDTSTGKRLIGVADFGVSAVIADGNTETANGTWIGG
ncbi:MAG: hypothetical protein ABGX08_17410 [Citromicrobium sp.]